MVVYLDESQDAQHFVLGGALKLLGEIEGIEDPVLHLAAFLIDTLIQYGLHGSPAARPGVSNTLDHGFKCLEGAPAPVEANRTKQSMLNG